ncbi:MAG: phospholipid carrier-dependent glycosyltransferase [Christensenellales bacterium]|jgi:dolichyl-phosphate-mannose-protein mannosyltransferase
MDSKRIVFALAAALMLILAAPGAAVADGENLLVNPEFESVSDGAPEGWKLKLYNYEEGYTETSFTTGRSGQAVVLVNAESNDARYQQKVSVEPDTLYCLSGYIMAEGVQDGWGANLSLENTFIYTDPVFDTAGQWEHVALYGRTGPRQTELIVCVRLGGYAGEAMGRAAFDGLSLRKADAVPAGYEEQSFESMPETEDDPAGLMNKYQYIRPILLIAALFLAAAMIVIRRFVRFSGEPRDHEAAPAALWVLMGLALALRVGIGAVITGYPNDIACWMGWANDTAENGLWGLYARGNFCDYPPGYMIVLWVIGKIRLLLGIPSSSPIFLVMVKLPAIAADLALGYLIYKAAHKRLGSVPAVALAGLYLMNPATLTNTAAWGQIDSLLALVVVAYLWLLYERKIVWASVAFVLGALIKPQMLLFGPVLLVVFIHFWIEQGWKKALRAFAISVVSGLALAAAVVLPFRQGQDFWWIIDKYTGTMGFYRYTSLSACNVYGLMGLLWKPDTIKLLGIPASIWGTVGIVAACLVFLIAALRDRSREHIFFYAAMLVTGIFGLGGRMHERYMYPALILLLLSSILIRDRHHLRLYILFSLTQFVNIALTLANEHLVNGDGVIFTLSALMMGGYIAMLAMAFGRIAPRMTGRVRERLCGLLVPEQGGRAPDARAGAAPSPDERAAARITNWKYTHDMRMTRRDWLAMGVLTAVYAVLAFTYLGDLRVPQTMWKASRTGESFVAEFDGEREIAEIWYYRGLSSSAAKMRFETRDASGAWTQAAVVDFTQEPYSDWSNELYKWFIAPEAMTGSAVRVTIEKPTLRLIEMAFKDAEGRNIPVKAVTDINAREEGGPLLLFDEQQLTPEYPSQMNGTYFDEIYHARTAWEHLNGIEPYENTHPPLGKDIISLGVVLFGMTPFGWRFMGALFGVLMIPVMYLLGKALFRDSRLAFIAAFLMTFDFMHFTQTRIATIDTYGVFFILCMYACMYIYYRMSFNNTPLMRTLVPLGLSGIFFGLGAASKWICLYAGAGLAVLFFYSLWMRWQEFRAASDAGRAGIGESEARRIRRRFPRNVIVTLLWCVLFFIIIPAGIYIASYIPYLNVTGAGHDLRDVWQNQINMFNYHSRLVDDHFFQSPWYQWPVIWKPMWFYQNTYLAPGWMGSIATMGNPAVWWPGLVAMVALLMRTARRRAAEPLGLFVAIGFLAQYLPWVLVPRSMFIYHYFASVPFIIFAVVYYIRERYIGRPDGKKRVLIYLGVVLLLFLWFYPVMSGLPIPSWLGRTMRWLPTWYFTY